MHQLLLPTLVTLLLLSPVLLAAWWRKPTL